MTGGDEKAGCYLAPPVKQLPSGEIDPDAQFTGRSFLGNPCEVGLYSGSSARQDGMGVAGTSTDTRSSVPFVAATASQLRFTTSLDVLASRGCSVALL